MQTTASQRLLSMALPTDASVAERGDAVQLHLRRNALEVVLTVPKDVREWFIEARDATSGTRVEDWCDYEGYGSSTPEQLNEEMANDVSRFVQRLFGSELMLESGHRTRLLWKTAGAWEQAVPLTESL